MSRRGRTGLGGLMPTVGPTLQLLLVVLLSIGANVLVAGIGEADFARFAILAAVVTVSAVALAMLLWRDPLAEALEFRSFLGLLPDVLVRQAGIGIDDAVFAEFERVTGATHITIVTDEIMSPLGGNKPVDADYLSVMQWNIDRGVHYRYVFPDRDYIRQRRERIEQQFASGVRVVTLSEAEWSQLPLSVGEYFIFERQGSSQGEIYVVQDPSPGSRSWARLSGVYAERWIGRTKQVLDGAVRP